MQFSPTSVFWGVETSFGGWWRREVKGTACDFGPTFLGKREGREDGLLRGRKGGPVKRGLVEAFRDVGCQSALVLAELPSRLDLLEKEKKCTVGENTRWRTVRQ